MIKKIFQILGVVSIISFSFFYTEKAANVIKEQDPIMQQILQLQSKYNIKAINREIVDKYYVIPGYNGIIININKSYSNMKRLGKLNESLLVYEQQKPIESIDDIYDKYIIRGNRNKRMVSFVFKVDNSDLIKPLLEILDNNNIKATFFLDGKWLDNNIDMARELIKKEHEVANYGYDSNYDSDFFVWTNNKLRQMKRKRVMYCYVEQKDFTILNLCMNHRMHTILPSIIVRNYPYIEIKNELDAGSIISFDITNNVIEELNIIIELIKNKGYNITTLSKHLSEKRL